MNNGKISSMWDSIQIKHITKLRDIIIKHDIYESSAMNKRPLTDEWELNQNNDMDFIQISTDSIKVFY